MKLYVIIVTYNGQQWIEHCLNSVYSSTIDAVPIVVDNGSTDNTLWVVKQKFPECHIIHSGGNVGFGRANNIGIRQAINHGADYVYLLNQDAWVDTECFERIINLHIKNPDYGILSPIQLTGDGKKTDRNFLLKFMESKDLSQFVDSTLSKGSQDIYEVEQVMAAHWMLYVPDLLKIGLFSPAFTHYGEDYNLIARYKYFHKKVGVCLPARACHDREYRETPPSKRLFINFVVMLRILNDPNLSTCKIAIHFFHFISRNFFRIHGVSLSERLMYIPRFLTALKESSKYRKIYVGNDPFNELKNLE